VATFWPLAVRDGSPGRGEVAGEGLLAITVEAAEELDPGVEINAVIE
jgi:hypothetical protein